MNKKLFIKVIFTAYCFFLIYVLFMRDNGPIDFSIKGIWERFRYNVNLTPFRTIRSYILALNNGNCSPTTVKLNIIGNAILFFPMGGLLPLLRNCNLLRTVINIALMIICAEVMQLLTGLGRLDIDDFILNLAGAVAGYLVFKILSVNKQN